MASPREKIVAASADCSSEELLESLIAVLTDRIDVLQELVEWAVPEHVYGTAKSLTARRYAGVVKSFSDKNGYGFISSPEIIEAFGMDLLVSDKQIHGFQKGDSVSFAILLNKGKPQAFDVTGVEAYGGGCHRKGAAPGSKGSSYKGYGRDGNLHLGGRGCGDFGSWPPPESEWDPHGGSNVWSGSGFARANSEVKGKGRETSANFVTQTTGSTGKLHALDPDAPPPTSKVAIRGVTDARYVGRVKSFKPNKFGFVECQELRQAFGGQDIYVHWDQLGHFQVGDVVSFGVIVNEKQGLKAVDLRPADSAEDVRPGKRPRHHLT